MNRINIRHISVPQWFPHDDPIAVAVARLCILREDLFLEAEAIGQEIIKPLDQNGDDWRRLYFWRNIFRTLENIRGAIQSLECQKDFKQALRNEPQEVQDGFVRLRKGLDKRSKEFLKELRNDLGGHVLEKAVQSALKGIAFDRKALLHLSPKVGNQHYKFVSEIVLQMMLPSTFVINPKRELTRRHRKTATGVWSVQIIDEIFNAYVRSRKLLIE